MSGRGLSRFRPTKSIPPDRIAPTPPLQLRGFSGIASQTIEFALKWDLNFEFVKRVGVAGAQGGALLFNERNDDGSHKRQVVVKYYKGTSSLSNGSLRSDADTMDLDDSGDSNGLSRSSGSNNIDANREYEALNELRGAKHIIQLLNPGKAILGQRLALLMEYVGHGDLGSALDRFVRRRQSIPSRILWSIFLCFIRACIAMDHPPSAPPDAPMQTETIPTVRTTTRRIQHSDMHFGNVLIGDIDEGEREHTFGPLLKLIDFGSARITGGSKDSSGLPSIASLVINDDDNEVAMADTEDNDDPNDDIIEEVVEEVVEETVDETMDEPMDEDNGEPIDLATGHSFSSGQNLWDVGIFMASLSIGEDILPLPSSAAYSIDVKNIWGGPLNIPIQAPLELTTAPITNDLRDLIRRCMALDLTDRPSLREALDICTRNVSMGPRAFAKKVDPSMAPYETDPAVKSIIKDFFLDADVTEDDNRLRTGRRMTLPYPQYVIEIERKRARRQRQREQVRPRRSASAVPNRRNKI